MYMYVYIYIYIYIYIYKFISYRDMCVYVLYICTF